MSSRISKFVDNEAGCSDGGSDEDEQHGGVVGPMDSFMANRPNPTEKDSFIADSDEEDSQPVVPPYAMLTDSPEHHLQTSQLSLAQQRQPESPCGSSQPLRRLSQTAEQQESLSPSQAVESNFECAALVAEHNNPNPDDMQYLNQRVDSMMKYVHAFRVRGRIEDVLAVDFPEYENEKHITDLSADVVSWLKQQTEKVYNHMMMAAKVPFFETLGKIDKKKGADREKAYEELSPYAQFLFDMGQKIKQIMFLFNSLPEIVVRYKTFQQFGYEVVEISEFTRPFLLAYTPASPYKPPKQPPAVKAAESIILWCSLKNYKRRANMLYEPCMNSEGKFMYGYKPVCSIARFIERIVNESSPMLADIVRGGGRKSVADTLSAFHWRGLPLLKFNYLQHSFDNGIFFMRALRKPSERIGRQVRVPGYEHIAPRPVVGPGNRVNSQASTVFEDDTNSVDSSAASTRTREREDNEEAPSPQRQRINEAGEFCPVSRPLPSQGGSQLYERELQRELALAASAMERDHIRNPDNVAGNGYVPKVVNLPDLDVHCQHEEVQTQAEDLCDIESAAQVHEEYTCKFYTYEELERMRQSGTLDVAWDPDEASIKVWQANDNIKYNGKFKPSWMTAPRSSANPNDELSRWRNIIVPVVRRDGRVRDGLSDLLEAQAHWSPRTREWCLVMLGHLLLGRAGPEHRGVGEAVVDFTGEGATGKSTLMNAVKQWFPPDMIGIFSSKIRDNIGIWDDKKEAALVLFEEVQSDSKIPIGNIKSATSGELVSINIMSHPSEKVQLTRSFAVIGNWSISEYSDAANDSGWHRREHCFNFVRHTTNQNIDSDYSRAFRTPHVAVPLMVKAILALNEASNNMQSREAFDDNQWGMPDDVRVVKRVMNTPLDDFVGEHLEPGPETEFFLEADKLKMLVKSATGKIMTNNALLQTLKKHHNSIIAATVTRPTQRDRADELSEWYMFPTKSTVKTHFLGIRLKPDSEHFCKVYKEQQDHIRYLVDNDLVRGVPRAIRQAQIRNQDPIACLVDFFNNQRVFIRCEADASLHIPFDRLLKLCQNKEFTACESEVEARHVREVANRLKVKLDVKKPFPLFGDVRLANIRPVKRNYVGFGMRSDTPEFSYVYPASELRPPVYERLLDFLGESSSIALDPDGSCHQKDMVTFIRKNGFANEITKSVVHAALLELDAGQSEIVYDGSCKMYYGITLGTKVGARERYWQQPIQEFLRSPDFIWTAPGENKSDLWIPVGVMVQLCKERLASKVNVDTDAFKKAVSIAVEELGGRKSKESKPIPRAKDPEHLQWVPSKTVRLFEGLTIKPDTETYAQFKRVASTCLGN